MNKRQSARVTPQINLVSEYNELLKEVRQLRKLKVENVELIERVAEEASKYNELLKNRNLNYYDAKLQIINNGYKQCARQRDEFKHQLNAAAKEIQELKSKVRDYQDRLSNSFHYDDMNRLQRKLDDLNKETLKTNYPLYWGGIDPDIHEQARKYTIEEVIDTVTNETTWEEAASDLALRVAKLEEQLKYTQKIICRKQS